jgi:iron complex transport system ATP-binding protein
MSRLQSENVTLTYDVDPIVVDLTLAIDDGAITTIIGPNGCGKSTLLRALSRLLKPTNGAVLLDGELIHSLPTRSVAQRLGLLSQQATPPGNITVEDLVRRGRYPHQGFFQPPSKQDNLAVEHALDLAGMMDLRHNQVDRLSGGQRQRAWIAMVLAQETPILLLDEPTTYLDVSHQIEIMSLVRKLNQEASRTIVMVLHDVNEAALVSDKLVAMRDGRIIGQGTPSEVLTPQLLSDLYGVACDVHPHPMPSLCDRFCVPRSRAYSRGRCASPSANGFSIEQVRTGHGKAVVSDGLTLSIPSGAITAVIGPNACGKSTLMHSCARLLKTSKGTIRLNGQDVNRGSHRALARRLAMMGQGPAPPDGLSVEDLVAIGRYPHQSWLRQWTADDETALEWALDRCRLTDLRYREVDTLSGGQRQRAWFAMSLVQDTPVMILDEPTTFLDLSAQIELLDIVWELNRDHGRTVVMVMHDLNLATRYADHLIAMKRGKVIAEGSPEEIVTPDLIKQVFDIDANVMIDPLTGTPLTIPTTGSAPLHQPKSAPSPSVIAPQHAPFLADRPLLGYEGAEAFAHSAAHQ